jgi:hypothetical protein
VPGNLLAQASDLLLLRQLKANTHGVTAGCKSMQD